MSLPIGYMCKCYLTRNYFVKQLGHHVVYNGNFQQFQNEYNEILEQNGVISKEDKEQLMILLQNERQRRLNVGKMVCERQIAIAKLYKPLHQHIYTLQESFFSPEFLKIVNYCSEKTATKDGLLAHLRLFSAERVYSLGPVFTKAFCKEFIEELDHFGNSDMPRGRINTMNNYGLLMQEVGFERGLITPFIEQYLSTLTRLLYPDWGGAAVDSNRAFVVMYRVGEDSDLADHYDNAEISLNISLGKDFEDGELSFGGMRTNIDQSPHRVEHKLTHGILHRGQHRHQALPITEGERYNLIIWMRSSNVRNKLCCMCDNVPDIVETIGKGDGFTKETIDVCGLG